MHRLTKINAPLLSLFLLVGFCVVSCAPVKPVVRDQLIVEKLRLRITKVRNAIAETRAVIAASKGAPYQAEIHMRLAELLSEEARYHYMVAYEREQRSTKSLHVPQVRFLKEQAIGTYREILRRYPDTHLADRILFNISHEQRELGLFDDMKKTLEQLIAEHLHSPYRTEALLVLGDFHFDRTQFVQAESNYRKIVAQKETPLLGLAYYKLGWVGVNLGDCKVALKNFEKAIVSDKKTADQKRTAEVAQNLKAKLSSEFEIPDDPDKSGHQFAGHKSVDVQREALVDLTYCYAQERKPEKAVEYLKGLAPSREAYVAALGKMANRYALIEQPKGGAEVARELLRLAPDDEERLDDARMLHVAVTRMKDYSDVGEDVYLILRSARRQMLRPNTDAAANSLIEKEFEMIARDMATKSHEILIEMNDEDAPAGKSRKISKWTKTPATAQATAQAYEAYLKVLPKSDNRLLIVQNMADVLMDGKQFIKAGHRYRETAKLLLEPVTVKESEEKESEEKKEEQTQEATEADRKKQRSQALYDAVVAYQTSLETTESRTHRERAEARAGLRSAGGLYLAEGDPDKDKGKKIKFAIAQSYYDEGSYTKAIDLLIAVAYEYPTSPQGDAAVHMVLDSYKTINDLSGLINAGRRFLADGSPVSAGMRTAISPIVEAAQQRRLDELSLAASGDQAGGMEILLAFAARYKDTELGEQAMLSAFVAARAGGDSSQLYSLGEQVMEQFPESDQAEGVMSTMGRTAAARFEFDKAIKYLEQAAQMSNGQKAALLLTAGKIRQQLADTEGAMKDYHSALEAAGDGAKRFEAVVLLADLIERDGSSQKVVDALVPLSDPPDSEISSRLGLALLRVGRHDEAEEQLRSVVEGAAAASPSAQARANYGMAEIVLHMLEDFDPPAELEAIEETVGLVDVVLQSYLAAARQPDPIYSQAALARLARACEVGADKLEAIKLPAELSEGEKKLVKEAMQRRATQLRSDSKEALAECGQRAKASYLLDEAGQTCIKGIAPKDDPVQLHPLTARKKAIQLKGVEDNRDTLSRNSDDLDALRTVGLAFLDAGDVHAARLVLGRAVEVSGDASDLNLLGVASFEAGDLIGAVEAFGRAKDAGSGTAARNLAALCQEMGLDEFATEVLQGIGPAEGRLISKAKGS